MPFWSMKLDAKGLKQLSPRIQQTLSEQFTQMIRDIIIAKNKGRKNPVTRKSQLSKEEEKEKIDFWCVE